MRSHLQEKIDTFSYEAWSQVHVTRHMEFARCSDPNYGADTLTTSRLRSAHNWRMNSIATASSQSEREATENCSSL